jgi:hypothetical protein
MRFLKYYTFGKYTYYLAKVLGNHIRTHVHSSGFKQKPIDVLPTERRNTEHRKTEHRKLPNVVKVNVEFFDF